MVADAEQLSVVPFGFLTVSRQLGRAGSTGERVITVRSRAERAFEFRQRLGRLFQFEQYLAQKLASRQDHSGSNGVFVSGIFVINGVTHLPQRFLILPLSQR